MGEVEAGSSDIVRCADSDGVLTDHAKQIVPQSTIGQEYFVFTEDKQELTLWPSNRKNVYKQYNGYKVYILFRRGFLSVGEAMSLIERIYKALRKEILEGELQPGTRLTETRLAKRFETSRTPVREAVARLKNEGLVCHKPGKGLVVREVSIRDMEELMGIRRVLEAYALDQAFDHMTEADLLQLELFINQAKYYLKKNDVNAIFEHNTKFHDYILEKSCNKRLQTILGNLMDPILRFRIMTLHYPGNCKGSIERHERLLQALKDRDRELARQIIVEDVTMGKKILLKLFDDPLKEKREKPNTTI